MTHELPVHIDYTLRSAPHDGAEGQLASCLISIASVTMSPVE